MSPLKPMRHISSVRALGTGRGSPGGLATTPLPGKVAGRPPANPGRTTLAPRGPLVLHLGQKPILPAAGPSDPPAFFSDTATISNVEWICYWASSKLFNDPVDPRQPPYTGGRLGDWEYQVAAAGGVAARSAGNSVTDFVYHLGTGDIYLRLDTFYYHTEGDPDQQARDLYLAQETGQTNVEVRTLYDIQLLGDPTGAAAIQALADVLAGRELINPARSGLAASPRDLVFAH